MVSPPRSRPDDPFNRWDRRIRRAQELQDRHPSAADPLRFYEIVLGFQRDLAGDLAQAARPDQLLRHQIDAGSLASKFPAILALAIEHGPDQLRQRAKDLQNAGAAAWRQALESVIDSTGVEPISPDSFFARAILQPVAENIQAQIVTDPIYSKSVCPACGGLPLLAILKPEGDGASRWLQCSFCLREWLFRRIICPYCAEENKEKLPRYTAEECEHVLIEACDTCHRYLKAVNMSVDGRAEPLVDEAALAVLDVWATQRGYTKIVPNLIGF